MLAEGAIVNAEENVDRAIQHVEHLYSSVTGQRAPTTSARPHAEIPAERDPAQYVEEQMERLVRALGTLSGLPDASPGPSLCPAMSVWESDESWLVCLDVPGVRREQIRISASGHELEVAADRSSSPDGAQLAWSEQPALQLRRVIAMPPDARVAEIRAELRDGVLEVRVPRQRGARVIPIS